MNRVNVSKFAAAISLIAILGLVYTIQVNFAYLELLLHRSAASAVLVRVGAPLESISVYRLTNDSAKTFLKRLSEEAVSADLRRYARADFIDVFVLDAHGNCTLRLCVRSRDDASQWQSRDEIIDLAAKGEKLADAVVNDFYAKQGNSCASHDLVIR
jgi:hypothetical protein